MDVTELAELARAGLDADEAVIQRNMGHGLHHGWPDYPTYDSPDVDAAEDYITRFEPPRLLVEVAAKRQLLDQALGWQHGAAEHGLRYYPCAALADPPDPCDCGRDERVLAVLQTLAAPYQTTEAAS